MTADPVVATGNDRAAVADTVATVGDGVGDVAAAADTIIDGTVADTGTVKKQNFHTGLDPVSRTNNSAQPTEFNAAGDAANKERYAQLSSLDTGSSPVWSVVVGTDATTTTAPPSSAQSPPLAMASATVPLPPSAPSPSPPMQPMPPPSVTATVTPSAPTASLPSAAPSPPPPARLFVVAGVLDGDAVVG